jgi:diaminopimelate decarboxylase
LLNNVAYLLSTITNIKKLTEEKAEIAIDAWFWELIRPKLYNSYHEIENVEKMERKEKKYDVRWNTVLQNDFLAKDRWLSEVEEWEHLIIKNVGAYGAVMSSGFPWKPKIKWVVMSQWNISKIHE